MTYTTTVRIPDELAEAVKVYCARTGASVNGALCVALERLVSDSLTEGGASLDRDAALRGESRVESYSRLVATPTPSVSVSGQAKTDFKKGGKA